ncbi:MAG: GTP pyrophosphokinase family protein [Actinomycetaceae bacterium]|nr:GTP pyrophosphokinase family protein [Actinomycetaceae bacterium]
MLVKENNGSSGNGEAKPLFEVGSEEEAKLFALRNAARPLQQSLMEYECALREIETKLRIIDAEHSFSMDANPIESIATRVKSPESIYEKLKRRGLPLTIQAMEENINDVAGVRVVCAFEEDVYAVALALASQDDLTVVQSKDYIQNPKPNGYRSYHMIAQVPIFLTSRKKLKVVEIQFRTIAMDFWASLEHKLRYKKNLEEPEVIRERLEKCATISAQLDREMQEIRHMIGNVSK